MATREERAAAALRPLVSKNTLSSLIKEMINEGRDKKSEIHDFYFACVNWIGTRGFRRGTEPPLPLLVSSSMNVISRRNGAFTHFLLSLLCLEEERCREIRETIKHEFGAELNNLSTDTSEFCGLVQKISTRIHETMEIDWDLERLSLLVGGLLIFEPIGEQKEAAPSKEPSAMEMLLKMIEELQADEPFWDQTEEFFAAVETIKLAKKDSAQRNEKIKVALEQLQAEYAVGLQSYFQLPIEHWGLERIRLGQEELVVDDLADLVQLLEKHSEISMQEPSTIQDRRRINQELQELEVHVSDCYARLNDYFASMEPELDPEQRLDDAKEQFPFGVEEPIVPEPRTQEQPKLDEPEEHAENTLEEPADENLSSADTGEPSTHAREKAEEQAASLFSGSLALLPEVDIEPQLDHARNLDGGRVPEQENPVLALLQGGDLAGAYWKLRAQEHEGHEATIPSWLVAAMEGSRYLLNPHFKLFKDFTYPNKYFIEDKTRFTELVALGVALVGSLVEPSSGSMGWLFDQEHLPNLQKFVIAVREFSYGSVPLRNGDLLTIASQDERNKAIVETARKCQAVIRGNADRRFGLPRVNRIWKELFGEQKKLRQALETIGSDRREDAHEVRDTLANWSTRDQILENIQRIDTGLLRKKDKPLASYERDRILRVLDEVLTPAEKWLTLVTHIDSDSPDWRKESLEKLIKTLKVAFQPCMKELEEACSDATDLERVALLFLQENLCLLLQYIDSNEPPIIEHNRYVDHGESIEEVLALRLLWFPELALADNGLPTNNDLTRLNATLWEPNPKWYVFRKDNYSEWLSKQDYRFLESILRGIGDDELDRDDLVIASTKQLQGSYDTLGLYCQQTAENIERALVNGVISEEQRVSFVAVVESIDAVETRNFPHEYSKLQLVDEELTNATQARIEHLKDIWEELASRLKDIASPEDERTLGYLVQRGLDESDTRVVDEYLAKVREHLDRNEKMNLSETNLQNRDYLLEFYDFRRALDRDRKAKFGEAMQAAQREKRWVTLNYGAISPKQLEQTHKAFAAWNNLSQRKKGSFEQSVTDLFSFLGFTLATPVQAQHYPVSSGYMHLPLKMEASDQSRPFPQFGSLAEPTFNVLMVWERPGADSIGTAVHESQLKAQSTILLYFGRIGDTARQDITRMTRQRNLPIAVLDETLFLYMTGERDARLRTFLRCSVPYSTVIPYTPSIAGDVPPEIFYGREEAVREIQGRDGSCLLYGGRQMGKSALLRQVRRQAHNPQRRHYAWVEDVKTLGDSFSNEKPSRIWTRFWRLLHNAGLVSGHMPDDDGIIASIEKLLRDDQDLHVILMLDEADNFLNQDAMEGFRLVTQLRRLMSDSERRFKVVFAGLQHVQRFQSLPNQPLAHFGHPILVGPLETEAATALVREPMEALGFHLDDACVYRILSFTNYHPGLIQIFCYHLLERLYKRKPALVFPMAHKPLMITKEDVESIYMQNDVRDKIRERFEWTLALDQRYQVITWAMIVAQMHIRDSFSREFSVGELYDLAKDFWPAEFGDTTSDAFRGLLRELSGLGVLSFSQGKYRLKSPNLVRLMGTEADIENRLFDYTDKPARNEIEPDSYHHLIHENAQTYSVFTFEQARSIDRQIDYRVVMVSKALGFSNVEESIKNLHGDHDKTTYKRLSISTSSLDEMVRLLNREKDRAKNRGFSNLVFYQIIDKEETLSLDILRGIYARYRLDLERKKTGMSFYFILSPAAYWKALKIDQNFMDELEADGAIIRVQTWNERGIGQRLDDFRKLNNEGIRKLLFAASGGWPFLLDEIMNQCGSDGDPQAAAEKVRALLTNGDLGEEFIRMLELPQDSAFLALLRFLVEHGEVMVEDISPELIESPSGISIQQCSRALQFLQQFGLVTVTNDVVVIDPLIKAVFVK